jgi:Holliday junction resolvase RusA-like endonuclease
MSSYGFRVHGIPAPQGSKKARVTKAGKPYVQEQSAKTLVPWRSAVKEAALAARGDTATMLRPIKLQVTFYMPRPASITPKKRLYPSVAPDLDKMVRGVGDALRDAGVYKDDAQIIIIEAMKFYATEDIRYSPGAWIVVQEIL